VSGDFGFGVMVCGILMLVLIGCSLLITWLVTAIGLVPLVVLAIAVIAIGFVLWCCTADSTW